VPGTAKVMPALRRLLDAVRAARVASRSLKINHRPRLVEGLVVFTILMAFVICAVRKPTPMSEALTATRRPVAIMP
jgi:hypothetical protein